MNDLLPGLAAIAFCVMGLASLSAVPAPRSRAWLIPAILAALFLSWSLYAVYTEGPLGFWREHVRNAWGNQIWFDLLLAIGAAWIALLPRVRAVAMHRIAWLVLIICTGSIGLLAMLSRCLFLEARRDAVERR